MAIVRNIVCDVCKKSIIDCDLESISVFGNISSVNIDKIDGIGGGLFGDGEWIKTIQKDGPIELHDVPLTHVHLECLRNYMKPTKR